MKDTIRQFVTSNFYIADPSQLDEDTSLLDSGIVDSTGVLEVIGFIEQEFGIKVAQEDMLPENLDSIAKIAGYVARTKPRAQGVEVKEPDPGVCRVDALTLPLDR